MLQSVQYRALPLSDGIMSMHASTCQAESGNGHAEVGFIHMVERTHTHVVTQVPLQCIALSHIAGRQLHTMYAQPMRCMELSLSGSVLWN